MAALKALAPEARERGASLLWSRWAALDRTDPITNFDLQIVSEASQSERRSCLVESHQIAMVDGQYSKWGCINNRGLTYKQNMNTLSLCKGREDFVDYLNDFSEAKLIAYPGPFGPLFRTGGDGRHRTQIMKALALPGLLVRSVLFSTVPRRAGDRARVFLDTSRPPERITPVQSHPPTGVSPIEPAAPHPAEVPTATWEQKVLKRDTYIAHLTALGRQTRILGLEVREGIRGSTATFEVNWDLPAYWALEPPEVVEQMSRRYARSYPRFTATEAGQAMCDRTVWLKYLGIKDTEAVVQRAPNKWFFWRRQST